MKPFTIFLRILTIVVVAEALVMVVFDFLNIHGQWAIVIDVVSLTVISSPLIYVWVIKPAREDLLARVRMIEHLNESVAKETAALRESEVWLQTVFNAQMDAVIAVSPDRKVVDTNAAAEKMFGYAIKEMKNQSTEIFHVDHEHYLRTGERVREAFEKRQPIRFEYEVKRKNGEIFPSENTLSPMIDERGERIGFVLVLRDLTERKKAEEEIKHLAYYDTLTDLPNRTLLRVDLQSAILTAQSGSHRVGLLLMDLDRFKEINDALGHDRGDLLLQQVGQRLRNAVWDTDRAARLGGDEFAVLLPRLAASEQIMEHINVVIQKILTALEAPFMIEGLPVAVEASIGAALYPYHGTDTDSLMQHADVAMYTAKESGSGYAVYSPDQDKYSPRGLALMGELRQGIEGNQLVLHYQPKVNLKTGRVFGVEALVRWRHPVYGFIPPDQFIEPAEQTGLIKPLTRWVFDTAQKQCLTWHRAGYDCTVSINLSARNLHDTKLPDEIAGLLQKGDGQPDRLQMEITETAIMTDPARAMKTIARLRAMGIRFSIDDFGIGYSSLAYIKKLPVDEIKIDKSFIINMPHNQNDAVIVRSTITMAHELNLKVVAEGVENKDIWDRLSALGCDGAQGYYMCRPIPAEDLTRWLTESPWGLKQELS